MKIAILASQKKDHSAVISALTASLGNVPIKEADVILTIGGDGFLLRSLHQHAHLGKAFYGLHRGTQGFLLNHYTEGDDILNAIKGAQSKTVHPLRMIAKDTQGNTHKAIAFNEVSLSRTGVQAAKLEIKVDGKTRMPELVGDGVLVSTPMGSTAYNQSANGAILPIEAPLLALTPICPFRPRRWNGALLPDNCKINLNTLDAERRPVHVIADFTAHDDIISTEIYLDKTVSATLLFAPGLNLDDRIRDEQFRV